MEQLGEIVGHPFRVTGVEGPLVMHYCLVAKLWSHAVRVIPPVPFAIGLVLAVLLPGGSPLPPPLRAALLLCGLAGVGLLFSGRLAFVRAAAEVHTFRTPRGLVDSGVFRYSRNPMYVGFTLTLVGAGALGGGWAGLRPALVFWMLVTAIYVPHEERVAARVLGEPYVRYCAATPRWLGLPHRGIASRAAS